MNLPHTVTVVEPTTGTDGRGDPVETFGSGVDVAAWMQQGLGPRGSSETLGDRDVQDSRWTMYSTSTPTMTGLARITWNGQTYTVQGQPNHLTTRDGYHHTEANLRLVEG